MDARRLVASLVGGVGASLLFQSVVLPRKVVVEEQITQPHQDQRVEIDPVIHSPELLVPHHQMGGEVMVVKVDNISHTDLAVAVVPAARQASLNPQSPSASRFLAARHEEQQEKLRRLLQRSRTAKARGPGTAAAYVYRVWFS